MPKAFKHRSRWLSEATPPVVAQSVPHPEGMAVNRCVNQSVPHHLGSHLPDAAYTRPAANPIVIDFFGCARQNGACHEILRPLPKRRWRRNLRARFPTFFKMTASAIDHKLALMLAIETINGMAKTAPMTEGAMRQALANPNPKPA
jgi:hypothetical protein